jgi:hypothetical protein
MLCMNGSEINFNISESLCIEMCSGGTLVGLVSFWQSFMGFFYIALVEE